MSAAACIFCKIIKGMSIYLTYYYSYYCNPLILLLAFGARHTRHPGHQIAYTANILSTGDIPSFRLFENEKVFAFLDIQPLSRGHAVCVLLSPSPIFPAPSDRVRFVQLDLTIKTPELIPIPVRQGKLHQNKTNRVHSS